MSRPRADTLSGAHRRELTRALDSIRDKNEKVPPLPTVVEKLECKVQDAEEALKLLKDGNDRFLLAEVESLKNRVELERRVVLHEGQVPHTAVLACSDSRAPPELIFDQGLGDLFVVRVAGNVVDTVTKASILYATSVLKVKLIVVMGHESCGAVTAALSPIDVIADFPADIQKLLKIIKADLVHLDKEKYDESMRITAGCVSNVHKQLKAIVEDDDLRRSLEAANAKLCGAFYSLNGAVTFFDEFIDH